VDNQAPVAVISAETRTSYFGINSGALGKEIELDGKRYQVIGVVEKPVGGSMRYLTGDVFLPITHMPSEALASTDLIGGFETAFLVVTPSKRQAMKEEIKQLAKNFVMPEPEKFNRIFLAGKTFEDQFATQLIQNDRVPEKSTRTMTWILVSLLSLFVLIPTLNLINLNLSRMFERADEIGVRKAFGATSSSILIQFIFENVIITLVGGAIGLIFALLLFNILNESKALGEVVLQFNGRVFFISVLITLLFGVLSGIIPALRMSRLHVTHALKQNQL
jgi:putative ABC transport system permease protein